MRRMRLVAPAAVARTARGSRDLETTRSVTTRLENGPRSARVAHSRINGPEIPTIRLGRPSAIRMKPPKKDSSETIESLRFMSNFPSDLEPKFVYNVRL